MLAKRLKKLLQNVDDNMIVVLDVFDHNYDPLAYASVVDAHDHGDGTYGQYGGEDCEEDCGPKTQVFHLG